MTNNEIIANLSSKFPERLKSCNAEFFERALNYFTHIFVVDLQAQEYSCGSLDHLSLFIGKDFRNSDLLFDIAKEFSEIFDPEYCVTLDTWESAIRKVVGENAFIDAFEEDLSNMERYRIVLTCFDPGEPPYADWYSELLPDLESAQKEAADMAKAECALLNDEDGAYPPGTIEGVFEVDDCANNDYEVRWYEKSPEDREETDCDINWVTTYNVYPVRFNENGVSCQYRGFEISSGTDGFTVAHEGTALQKCGSVKDSLNLVDDICLTCTKDKTYALESVHKLPLELKLKFTKDLQQIEQQEGPVNQGKQKIEER